MPAQGRVQDPPLRSLSKERRNGPVIYHFEKFQIFLASIIGSVKEMFFKVLGLYKEIHLFYRLSSIVHRFSSGLVVLHAWRLFGETSFWSSL